ncbi:MAG: thiolase family protein [Parachlamydiaceae bacterium]|nr:thiolase family protein [Parachlamydiaceae bacterium]
MTEQVAIIDALRTPFCRAGGVYKDIDADDLGAQVVKELMARTGFPKDQVEYLIFGNVLQPSHAANIARVIAVKAGLPISIPAHTVNRNCASGMEAITEAAELISTGKADAIIAGGTESMSNSPILFSRSMRDFLLRMSKAKTWTKRLSNLMSFRLSMLKPQMPELADPLCGLNMGQTAELLSRDLHVTRAEQDLFALSSQQRASEAMKKGFFDEEIVPILLPPQFNLFQKVDDGIRGDQSLELLSNLKPVFDRYTGSVTAGTSSQITDGAAALLLVSESKANALRITPKGFIRDYIYVGLDPSRMGLGPAIAIGKLLEKTSYKLSDFDLIEINEAFAAQVLACEKGMASVEFSKKYLNKDEAIGIIDPNRLNVNGGAISLGHPLGASGARLVLTLLHELRRRKKRLGLAALCVGGGQGAAVIVEAIL